MARATFHEAVKRALQKERWLIAGEPLRLEVGMLNFQIDLGAERVIAAERDSEKIAVEIKSLLHPSIVTDFYPALSQFLSYRLALGKVDPDANSTWLFPKAFTAVSPKRNSRKLQLANIGFL